jgi:hypothetical protein
MNPVLFAPHRRGTPKADGLITASHAPLTMTSIGVGPKVPRKIELITTDCASGSARRVLQLLVCPRWSHFSGDFDEKKRTPAFNTFRSLQSGSCPISRPESDRLIR